MVVRKKTAAPIPKWLTQEQYVNRRGEACPGCSSENVSQIPPGPIVLNVEAGIVHRDLRCGSCGASWTDQLVVAGFAHYRSPGSSQDKKARRKARREARKRARLGV